MEPTEALSLLFSLHIMALQLARFLLLGSLLLFPLLALGEATQEALTESARVSNESLLWGPYRPNLYFGVRPRIPKSLLTGLLWAKVDSFQGVQNSEYLQCRSASSKSSSLHLRGPLTYELSGIDFRHTCEQHEGMAGYGWDEYDVRQGGRQTIHDAGNSMDITTEFVKIPGGTHGGSWAVRVKGTPREDAPERLMSTVLFYAGMEGFGSLNVNHQKDELGIEGVIKMGGSSNELGDFTLEVTEGPDTNRHPRAIHPSDMNKPLDRSIVTSLQVPEGNMWQAKRTSMHCTQEELLGFD